MKDRRKVAILCVGMVGSGPMEQGIPAFTNVLQRLSEEVQITIYSFIPVKRTNVSKAVRVRSFPMSSVSNRVKYIWLGILILWDHIRDPYHCFHAYSPYPSGVLAFNLAALLNRRYIITLLAGEMAHLPEINFGDLLNINIKSASIRVCESANGLIAFSEFQKSHLLKNISYHQHVHVIPFSLEVPLLGKLELSYPIQLLHVSHYHPIKDYDTLLNTIEILKSKIDVQLSIVGEHYDDAFLTEIRNRNLQNDIILIGSLPNNKLKRLYQSHHILIHTSKFEGLPMVAIEAMANGTVICGTAVGIIHDLAPECCVAVEVGNHVKLAEEIIKLVDAPGSYYKLREQAYRWICDHDINWHLKKMTHMYDA
ncbi:MAG TPA: hypothetical protein DIW27_02470 [Cytophagales bacterium]|nr:hypothetical protein [Cytophagales bacterium]